MAQKLLTSLTIRGLASAASEAESIYVNADTNPRLLIDAGGKLTWGSGTATGDTNLYRTAADSLKTDDGFSAATLFATTSIDGSATFGAFASCTTLTEGYTGTATSTYNISTGAVAASNTKTINIGTGGAASSTTTISIGTTSGASSITIGASNGTTTINSATLTLANATTLNINGASPTLASSSTGTLTLFNTALTTVNAFGAATTATIGYSGTAASTLNISTGVVAASTTKTINIGTGGAASSTTNIGLGSSNGGITTVNSPILSTSNIIVGGTTAAASATNSLHMYNATAPTGNITNGGIAYVESGALKFRGSGGSINTISPASSGGSVLADATIDGGSA